jgi:hypothetical protein
MIRLILLAIELSIYALIEGVFAVFPTSVEDNVASGIIFAINSLAILVFISLVTLVLSGFSASSVSGR